MADATDPLANLKAMAAAVRTGGPADVPARPCVPDLPPVTDAEAAAWRAACEGATPGDNVVVEVADNDDYWHDVSWFVRFGEGREDSTRMTEADARYTAAARSALPRLLAERDRLRAELEAVREAGSPPGG